MGDGKYGKGMFENLFCGYKGPTLADFFFFFDVMNVIQSNSIPQKCNIS